jgi:hypothetical protein
MFGRGNIEDELMRSMEKELVSHQLEEQRGFNKLMKAVDYLNVAASIFDQAGFYKEASKITEIIKTTAAANLIKEAIDTENITEIFNKIDSLKPSAEDLKNVFEATTPGMLVKFVNKLYHFAQDANQKGIINEIKDLLNKAEEGDTWEDIKSAISSKLTTALKMLNLIKTFA